ncbi:MAG UNVERIFIED_CONTAM: hypothetical protein LVR18_35365 [Planctomycetaceae bacterium]
MFASVDLSQQDVNGAFRGDADGLIQLEHGEVRLCFLRVYAPGSFQVTVDGLLDGPAILAEVSGGLSDGQSLGGE